MSASMTPQSPKDEREQLNFFIQLINRIRLVWLLFWDNRISPWIKSVLPLSWLYLLWPIDIIPDVAVGVGQLDDLGIILFGMALFVRLCPPEIVEQYLGELNLKPNQPQVGVEQEDPQAIDASYQVLDEADTRPEETPPPSLESGDSPDEQSQDITK